MGMIPLGGYSGPESPEEVKKNFQEIQATVAKMRAKLKEKRQLNPDDPSIPEFEDIVNDMEDKVIKLEAKWFPKD